MLEGGCLCGGVRYSVDGPVRGEAVCHCRNCQRQGGSAFSVLAAVDRGALTISGDPALYVDHGESGAEVHRHFCRTCGSPLYSSLPASPAVVYLKAGTLDAPQGMSPRVHVWCDSAWAWPGLPQDAIRFPRNPPSA